jgi:hypothetical protein
MTGIALGESPRWHDGRLWFADWVCGTAEDSYRVGDSSSRGQGPARAQPRDPHEHRVQTTTLCTVSVLSTTTGCRPRFPEAELANRARAVFEQAPLALRVDPR